MGLQFNEKIAAIPVYPAAETYEFNGNLTKLASNESPFEPHPGVVAAVAAAARNVNRYCDPTANELRQQLAARYDCDPARIAVGNGSCEILLAAAEAMLEPGAEIVYAWPSFSMYPHLAAMTGATAIEVPLNDEWRHDLEALAAAVTDATRIVIICNPNNPTGTTVPNDEILAFTDALPPSVLVIVDEAYVEFVRSDDRDSLVAESLRRENLVLLRTFSKAYGLAGLRVGYALCAPPFKQAVDIVRQPFSVNMLAQVAGAEALKHPQDAAERVSKNWSERDWVEGRLRDLGVTTALTDANFTWLSLGDRDEDTVVNRLAQEGVIVRAGKALGAEGFLRVTYGDRSENERFLSALAGAL